MRYWIGITDYDWYRFLAARPDLDEVNFWQPSARRSAVSLPPGAPFLFKLHAREGGAIVGGGFVARYSRVPVYLAWEAFEQKNGAASLEEMVRRVQRYRRETISVTHDELGCWILSGPFFFPRGQWIAPPDDWAPNIVQGKTYDDQGPIGGRVWRAVEAKLEESAPSAVSEERYGAPLLVTPRLGQGGFRIAVTDAYGRRFAITSERTLPALDAAHIVPYSQRGDHRVDNDSSCERTSMRFSTRAMSLLGPILRSRSAVASARNMRTGGITTHLPVRRYGFQTTLQRDRTPFSWTGTTLSGFSDSRRQLRVIVP